MRTPQTFKDLVLLFVDLINLATPLVAGVTLLVFFWGLAKFIRNAGDTKSHEDGKNLMIYGVLALFVLFSVWGIIHYFQLDLFGKTFGVPYIRKS